jgi:hypothetical protein
MKFPQKPYHQAKKLNPKPLILTGLFASGLLVATGFADLLKALNPRKEKYIVVLNDEKKESKE